MNSKYLVATFISCNMILSAQEAVTATQIETPQVIQEVPIAEANAEAAPEVIAEMQDNSAAQQEGFVEADEPCCVPCGPTLKEVCPCPPKPCDPVCDDTKIVIPSLKGLLLICSNKSVRTSDLENIEGVVVDDVDLPGSCDSLYKYLKNFWCEPVRQCDLPIIKQMVVRYYRDHNIPVVEIKVPPQSVKSGVLQLMVQESRLGCVRSVCNKYFCSERLEGYIRTPTGCRIKADSLVLDLNWINRNPFRTTDLVFTKSQYDGYTDIELVTVDQFPWRLYGGADNTGIAQSGHNRYFVGFNWGNAFWLDHIFTYQFTTGTHYNEFWAHSANYTAPLSWRHTLDIYGGYSEVKADLQGTPGVSTKGSSAQASLRYEIPLPPGLSILEEFTWGFDWKRTNTNLLNDDLFFFGKTVNITQLMVGINAGLETERTKNSGTIEVFWSPGRWLPDQQNSHYNDLRAGAKNTYVYGRVSVASIFRLPSDFTFEPSLRYQISSANLLASEQFGLGGYNTVRGYEEREVNGDNAIIANIELRTRPVSLLGTFCECSKRKYRDELRFLVFLDYGYAKDHKLYFNQRKFQYLMGAGPGLRYVIQKYLTVRLDYGWKLRQIDFGPNPLRHMLHFGVVLSI